MNYVAVFLGGGLGSMVRYGISVWSKSLGFNFPFGTLLSNVIACLILGIVVWQFESRQVGNGLLYVFLAAGFCGGFSTFSTFGLETVDLIRQGEWLIAILNILISLAAGIGSIWFLLGRS